MIQQYITGKVFVCIDAANLERSLKNLEWHVDYCLLKRLFERNQMYQIRYYCADHKTANQGTFFSFLRRMGYVLVTKPLKVISDVEQGDVRKANFDVEIAVDSMRMISHYDTLVLFSGDSDFCALLKYLRRSGKHIVVISTRHHVSRELIHVSNKFVNIKKLRMYVERLQVQKSPSLGEGPSTGG